jgi:dihydrofolate reductase
MMRRIESLVGDPSQEQRVKRDVLRPHALIREDVPAEVSKLEQADGKDILIGGSSTLAKTLIDHGLIDEIRASD